MQDYQIKQLAYGHKQQENEIEALRKQIVSANDTIEKLKKENAERISTDILFEIKKRNIEMPPEFTNVKSIIHYWYYDGILFYAFRSNEKYYLFSLDGTINREFYSGNENVDLLFVYKLDYDSDDIYVVLKKTNSLFKYNKTTKQPPSLLETIPLYEKSVIFNWNHFVPYKNKIILHTSKRKKYEYVPPYFDLDDKRLKPLTDFPYYNKYFADKNIAHVVINTYKNKNKKRFIYFIKIEDNTEYWWKCSVEDFIDNIGEPQKIIFPKNYYSIPRSSGNLLVKKDINNDTTYVEIVDDNYENTIKKFSFPTSNAVCNWYVYTKNYTIAHNIISNTENNEFIAVNISNDMFEADYSCNDINATELPLFHITEPGKADYVVFKPSNKACMLNGKIVTKCII